MKIYEITLRFTDDEIRSEISVMQKHPLTEAEVITVIMGVDLPAGCTIALRQFIAISSDWTQD